MSDDINNNDTPQIGKAARTPAERARNIIGNIKAEQIKAIEQKYKQKVSELLKKKTELQKSLAENDKQLEDAQQELADELQMVENN